MEIVFMVSGIQFLIIIFSLLLFYVTFLHFKKKHLGLFEAIFFSALWVGMIFLTLFPKSSEFILRTFRVYRLLDLATILGFLLILGLVFNIYLSIKDLKSKIEKVVREKALEDREKNHG